MNYSSVASQPNMHPHIYFPSLDISYTVDCYTVQQYKYVVVSEIKMYSNSLFHINSCAKVPLWPRGSQNKDGCRAREPSKPNNKLCLKELCGGLKED